MLFKKEVIVRTGNFLQKKLSAWHASFTGFGSFADVLSERKAATRRGDGPSACAEPSEEPAHFPERPPLVPGRVPRNDAGPARSALVRDLAAMPRIDIAAYLWQKFQEGPASVGYIKALESVTVILVPMTPAISWCTRRFGHSGAAVLCAGLMAVCWLLLVDVTTMHALYAMVLLRSAISTCYEPSIKSILMDSTRARKREQIGSLTGLQQTMKGMAQVRC